MKLRNPNFVAPGQGRIDALRGKLAAYLAANAGEPHVDFDAIRTDIGPANLTDGEIAQAAQDAGLEVGP